MSISKTARKCCLAWFVDQEEIYERLSKTSGFFGLDAVEDFFKFGKLYLKERI
jgi:hypothetical protein